MNQIQRLALTALCSMTLGSGAALAANPTATAADQQPAATPAEAEKPRLPAASDTHRAGPTQSEAGSGNVPDVPPTLSEDASPGAQVKPGTPDADGSRHGHGAGSAGTRGPASDAGAPAAKD